MSKCDLEIVLDARPFAPGDRIEGLVGVTVNKGCTCNGLNVRLEWRTHGRGNRQRETVHEEQLFVGEWTAGERHAHPFSLTVPNGPFTYHGTLLNVDLYVVATADIPWAFDPKTEQLVTLHPPAAPGPVDQGNGPPPIEIPAFAGVLTVAIGVIFAIVGASFFTCFGMGVCFGDEGLIAIPFLLIPLVFFFIGAVIAYKTLQPLIAKLRFGEVGIEAPAEALPGATVPVTITLAPKRAVSVDDLSLVLTAREVVVSGSGTNRSTHRHELYSTRVSLAQNVQLSGLQTFETEVQLPDDAPLSFNARDNRLEWTLDVRVDVPGPFDPTRKVFLRVRPETRRQ